MRSLDAERIGRMHAANVARHPRTTLSMVYDINSGAANEVAQQEGARVARSPEEVFGSSDVDAVLIATATPTHADYIEMAAAAGKAALCEKPIDLDLQRVALCRERIAGSKAPVQIGFNRRFDPGHKAARDAVRAGEIGASASGDHHFARSGAAASWVPHSGGRAASRHDHS